MLFTNRLSGQWLVEGEAWSKDDPAVGIGSGLSKVEAGFRLRYEFHRQFAPYVGVVWERAYGGTADQRHARSGDVDDTRVVAGVRIWFCWENIHANEDTQACRVDRGSACCTGRYGR